MEMTPTRLVKLCWPCTVIAFPCLKLYLKFTPLNSYTIIYLPVVRGVLYFVSGRVKGTRNVHHTEPTSFDLNVPATRLGSHCIESISYFGHPLAHEKIDEAAFFSSNDTNEENGAMVGTLQFLVPFYGQGTLYKGELAAELSFHFPLHVRHGVYLIAMPPRRNLTSQYHTRL